MERRGIDFFPMACQQTEQMELIEAQYGLKGFAVIHKLYQNIFNGEGVLLQMGRRFTDAFQPKKRTESHTGF